MKHQVSLFLLLLQCGCGSSGEGPTLSPDADTDVDEPPTLNVFYAVHLHAGGDELPYLDEGLTLLDPTMAQSLLDVVEAIAEVADAHGIPITWEVVQGSAKGLCSYDTHPDGHVLQRVLNGGHEVGIHAHDASSTGPITLELVNTCGIDPSVNSGFMVQVSKAEAFGEDPREILTDSLWEGYGLGMGHATENLSPDGEKNPFGVLCDETIGVDNDMWEQTGNLIFPWRPDLDGMDPCSHDEAGPVVMIDHVQPGWTLDGETPADVLSDAQFGVLQGQLDEALAYVDAERPERVAAWGFVTHVSEYMLGNDLSHGPDEAGIVALDTFLTHVAAQREVGLVSTVTTADIASLVREN